MSRLRIFPAAAAGKANQNGGSVHETEAMRRMAAGLGVPDGAIILETDGLNTAKTAANTCEVFRRLGMWPMALPAKLGTKLCNRVGS